MQLFRLIAMAKLIIVLAGANGEITREHIDSVLNNFAVGDLVVMQNEISNVDYLIEKAHEKQMKIAFNPSPLNERISMCDLNLVDLLFVNEIEGAAISSGNTCLEILHMLNEKYPEMSVVLTLGGNGSLYKDKTGQITLAVYIRRRLWIPRQREIPLPDTLFRSTSSPMMLKFLWKKLPLPAGCLFL